MKVRYKKLKNEIEGLRPQLRITKQQIEGYAETAKERDEYRATVGYYERALYFSGFRPVAVCGGRDAMEINPEKVADIIKERDIARRLYLDRDKDLREARA